MSYLGDDIWNHILSIGVKTSTLSIKDLCSLSISCRRFNKLTNENTLWSNLLTLDFSESTLNLQNSFSSSSESFQSPKALYKTKFEREKRRLLAAHRRAVLRIESKIFVHSQVLKELQARLVKESEKFNSASAELSNLDKARRASVALNVWQPNIVRGRQKQIVEQCDVPIESRIAALQMELRLCKQQISVFDKRYKDEKQRLDAAKEKLKSIKYHPLRDYKVKHEEIGVDECNVHRKKLKKSIKE